MLPKAMFHPHLDWQAKHWQQRQQWSILDTDFLQGQYFFFLCDEWRRDPLRPQRLNVMALVEEAPLWDLTPGVHRLSFDKGQIQLTIAVGPREKMIRQIKGQADHVLLHQWSCNQDPFIWKALAKLCQFSAQIVVSDTPIDLDHAKAEGFITLESDRSYQLLSYQAHWLQKKSPASIDKNCTVLGSGLAGASLAYALAERGWRVHVMDSGSATAQGASGVPVGLLTPHVSADDNDFSRLSRAGMRQTLAVAHQLLKDDGWLVKGVLENRIEGKTRQAGFPRWHSEAGWIKPKHFIDALLNHPLITLQLNASIQRIQKNNDNGWDLFSMTHEIVSKTPHLVIACGPASVPLIQTAVPDFFLPYTPIRGQISWGSMTEGISSLAPTHPVSGHCSFIPQISYQGQMQWFTGSTFDRSNITAGVLHNDHLKNIQHLLELIPSLSDAIDESIAPTLKGWAGVRCSLPDRMPVVGSVDPEGLNGLYVLTGLGSRGLCLGPICAEVLASHLNNDPSPIEIKLLEALNPIRYIK